MNRLLSRPKLYCITFLAVVPIATVIAIPAQHTQIVSVGPNVEVSAARSREDHFETVAAADPRDANRMIAAAMLGKGAADGKAVVYFSGDGGRTWEPVLKTPDDGRGWDPEVGFAAD